MAVKQGPTHLVIPDVHVKYNQDLRRLDWLGQIIVEEQPDTIICLGDFADMESLSSYDKGTRRFEGRRVRKDLEAAREGMRRLLKPLRDHNKKKARFHERQYKPRMVMLLGNHEYRIERATNLEPQLEGVLSLADLKYEAEGWEVYPFLNEVEIDGVTYSHYFISGVMGRPIGGENPAKTLLHKHHKSCTAGHTHIADWAQRRRGDEHIMGLLAGCYFEHEEEYVPPSVNAMWWRGIVIKRNVKDGCYDPQFMSLNTIKKRFLK